MKIQTQEISTRILDEKDVQLFVKRIDLTHEFISGNKWYKLKYNLLEAKRNSYNTLLTFGGAYSNHILATSVLANENGFKSIGIIRGERCAVLNPTLKLAEEHGMQLHYVNRKEYQSKQTSKFLSVLKNKFGDFYLIPEGGSNKFALKGTAEIITKNDSQDYICCSVGTGTTLAGIINSSSFKQNIIGFPAIKGVTELEKEIKSITTKSNWQLNNDFCFGGYAKTNSLLINFINTFNKNQLIPLDAIYTGKMMFGILELIAKDYFPKGSSILAIHTGGLQGNKGMNQRFGFNLP